MARARIDELESGTAADETRIEPADPETLGSELDASNDPANVTYTGVEEILQDTGGEADDGFDEEPAAAADDVPAAEHDDESRVADEDVAEDECEAVADDETGDEPSDEPNDERRDDPFDELDDAFDDEPEIEAVNAS